VLSVGAAASSLRNAGSIIFAPRLIACSVGVGTDVCRIKLLPEGLLR
jgi:hypothetical protein